MKEINYAGIGTLIIVVIIIVALSFASTKGPIRDGQYAEVPLKELSMNPEKYGDGYQVTTDGCPMMATDRLSKEPVKIQPSGRFLYSLQESHVPLKICTEIVILTFDTNLPCKAKVWGTLRKGEIVPGKKYYLEVDGYKFQKQLAN